MMIKFSKSVVGIVNNYNDCKHCPKSNIAPFYDQITMQKELECIKIKDGLYLGNLRTAQDCQFLLTNKFEYVVNCAIQIPNFFENANIKYLKFKLVKEKAHKLWDGQSVKKLKKLHEFIQKCEQQSACCLIHSYDGFNRSLVMLAAYLMSRYWWKLPKTLDFIRSKQVFIGLSEHNLDQLQGLERILQHTNQLSLDWRINYMSEQEEIISKTYLNSRNDRQYSPPSPKQLKQKPIESNTRTLFEQSQSNQRYPLACQDKKKSQKRVTWADNAQKEKKKSTISSKNGVQQKANQTGTQSLSEISSNLVQNPRIFCKNTQKDQKDSIKAVGSQGKGKKAQPGENTKNTKTLSLHQSRLEKNTLSKPQLGISNRMTGILSKGILDRAMVKQEDDLIKMINNNLKFKKKKAEKDKETTNNSNCSKHKDKERERKQKSINYNLTINNFIKPNINIINNLQSNKPGQPRQGNRPKQPRQGKRPKSACHKEEDRNSKHTLDKQKLKLAFQTYKEKTKKTSPPKEKKTDKGSSSQLRKFK